jgi:peptidoglycan/LPS O-acetylase OafA/YrhL
MDYRREIDGLRALAVLPVILFHAGFETFSGGFVGVDVFFVISGYLITTIILSELEQGKFSIVNFYERRARRILPALFLVMLVCIPFAWFWLLPSDMKDFSQSLVAVSVFASNILFWRESGYFDTAAELKPLLHTWSLAVEEQYYVLFPLFLMLFWKLGKRWILVTLGLVFVASLAVAQWAAYAKPAAAFYLLPTRGWELLIGAFAAFYLSKANRKEFGKGLSEVAGWLGVALIMYSVFAYSKTTPFPGFYALVPTIGTVLIILFATQQTTVGKFVGNKAFVGVGLVSYSAYLWHQPLFAFAKAYTFHLPTIQLISLLIFISFALAFLSFKYVETPFRVKGRISRARIFWISVFGILFFTSVGLWGNFKDGFNRGHESITEAIGDWQHPGNLQKTSIAGFYKSNASRPVDILFFGDSHAEQFAPLASVIEGLGRNVGFLSGGGCPPVPSLFDDLHPHCFDLFERLNQVLSSEGGVKTVVLAGCFNCYFIDQARAVPVPGDRYNYYYLSGNDRLYFRKGEGQAEALASLNNFLRSLTLKYQLVFFGDNPSSDNFNPTVFLSNKIRGDSTFFKERYPSFSGGEFQVTKQELMLDGQLRSVTPSEANFISLLEIVCPNNACKATNSDGAPIYKDGNHMRPFFVREVVGPYLRERLKLD